MFEAQVHTNKKQTIFIVQEHHVRTLHYDFRLEKAGILKSWAVPKGIPLQKGTKHLALEVENHHLDYADFEGVIEEGQYGTGTVIIWDKGTYQAEEWKADKIVFNLEGGLLKGRCG